MRQPTQRPNPNQQSELAQALASCRGAFVATALMSGMSNILMLTGAIFMLEIYDRVLPSRSIPTLVALVILAAGLFLAQGLLDMIRGRVLVRIGARLDEELSGRVYETIVRLPLKVGNRSDGLQPLRDLDSVRSFLSGPGPTALFDLPWLPIYLAICFAFHPYIGLAALVGAIVLGGLTLMTELMTREPTRAATGFATTRSALAEASRRNAEALTAMGMVPRIAALWQDANSKYMASQQQAADVAGGFGSMSKVLRMMLQSGVLAVGAYLVIYQQATAGIIIAGSILSARALAPVDLAIANWRGFVARPPELAAPDQAACGAASSSSSRWRCSRRKRAWWSKASRSRRPAAKGLSFTTSASICRAGTASESSVRAARENRRLRGCWSASGGRFAAASASMARRSTNGRRTVSAACIGYLPQDVELLAGTVAQNIARFATPVDADAVISAATAAGVHELIVSLPDGYETQVGESGTALSAGQAQRVALARALYGDPFLVVLDEPNSNLDSEGDEALSRAIMGVRARGGIVVVVAHRPSAIASVDLLLMMSQGRASGIRAEGRSAGSGAAARRWRRRGRSRSFPKRGLQTHEHARFRSRAVPFAATRWQALSLLLVLVGGVGGWAGTMTLSGALIAPGSVVVDSNVKKVQHPTGGIVGELRARDGDRVKAGDIVVRLDDTVTRANLAIVTKGLNELDRAKARLESERDGAASVTFPADLLARVNDPDAVSVVDERAQAVRSAPQRPRRPEGAAATAHRAAQGRSPRLQRPAGIQGQRKSS